MQVLRFSILTASMFLGITMGCQLLLNFPLPADIDLLFNIAEGQALQAADEPLFSEQSIFETIPEKIGSHAATITAFDDGELLAAWYSYEGPHELDGSAIYMARRLPGNNQWEAAYLHIDRPLGEGNPVLYSEGDKVWLFQAVVPGLWSTAHLEMQQSSDRGQTWSLPQIVSSSLGSNVRFPPIRTANGNLLLPAYDDLLQRSLFFTSDDGDSWQLQSSIYTDAPHNCIQPSVARLDNDRLLAVMRNTGSDWLWVTASDDYGASWSQPIDSNFPNPASPAALLQLAGGNLILVFNDSANERKPLAVAISSDQGQTWSHKRIIADGSSTYSYPSVIQTSDSLIHLVYSLGREEIKHTIFNESWIISAD